MQTTPTLDLRSISPWNELLPRDRKSACAFVSRVLSIPLKAARDLCDNNRVDSAIVVAMIQEISKSGIEEPLSKKWRANFPGFLDAENWVRSENTLELYELVSPVTRGLSPYTSFATAKENRCLPPDVMVHKRVHQLLLSGIPEPIYESLNPLLDWLKDGELECQQWYPFMQTGSAWQFTYSVEQFFRAHMAHCDVQFSENDLNIQISNLVHICNTRLGARKRYAGEICKLEKRARETILHLHNNARQKIIKMADSSATEVGLQPSPISCCRYSQGEPGDLLARLLIEITINRSIREFNTHISLIRKAGLIAKEFMDEWNTASGGDMLEEEHVMTAQAQKATIRRYLGKNSVFGKQYPTRALREDVIDCLVRVGEEIDAAEPSTGPELSRASVFMAICACAITEVKTGSDKQRKNDIRILPGRTTTELATWQLSVEARFLIGEVSMILRWHMKTNILSAESIRTTTQIRVDRSLQVQNLVYGYFKHRSLDFHRNQIYVWKAIRDRHAEQLEQTKLREFRALDTVVQNLMALGRI